MTSGYPPRPTHLDCPSPCHRHYASLAGQLAQAVGAVVPQTDLAAAVWTAVEELAVVGVLEAESAGVLDVSVWVLAEAYAGDSGDGAVERVAEGEPDESAGVPVDGSAGDSADVTRAGPGHGIADGPGAGSGYAGEGVYGTSSWRRSAGEPAVVVVAVPAAAVAVGAAEPAVLPGGPGVLDGSYGSDDSDGSSGSGVPGDSDGPGGSGGLGGLGEFDVSDVPDASGEIAVVSAGQAGQVEEPAVGHAAGPAAAWAGSWPAGDRPSAPTAVATVAADHPVGGRRPRRTRRVPGLRCASKYHWGRFGRR